MAISAAMIAHLQGSPTTLCHAWRIEERAREVRAAWTTVADCVIRGGSITTSASVFTETTNGVTDDGYFKFTSPYDSTGVASTDIYFYAGMQWDGTAEYLNVILKRDGSLEIVNSQNADTFVSAAHYFEPYHTIKIVRDGTTFTVYYDRTLIHTTTLTGSDPTVYAQFQNSLAATSMIDSVFGKNPTVVTVCNHTRNLIYNSETYLAFPLMPTRIARAEGLNTDNSEIASIFNSSFFTKEDLKRGRWNQARVEMRALNYNDLTMGAARTFVGYTGDIKLGNGVFTVELRSLSQLMQQEIGEVTSALCRARRLGNDRCGLDITSYTHTAEIIAVTDDHHFTINLSPAKADDYFANGEIYWTQGNNRFNYAEIRGNVGNLLTLKPLPSMLVEVSDIVVLIKGCNRTREACKGFVNTETPSGTNIENFVGEPDIPGLKKIYTYEDAA